MEVFFIGGSLIQHMHNYEEHSGGKTRTVRVKKNSKLGLWLKETQIKGKCYHHQIIEKKGVNIEPVVYDSDGIIHGIELNEPGRWVVGVQWHPERSHDEKNRAIIREFVRQAQMYKFMKIMVIFICVVVLANGNLKDNWNGKDKKAQ